MSKRATLEDALCDLCSREKTTRSNIGSLSLDAFGTCRSNDQAVKAIGAWAKERKIDAVVWTKLPSNFEQVCGKRFTVKAAITHIQNLDSEGKAKAAEYVWRAPSFVDTPLRRILESKPWFVGKRQLTHRSTRTRAKAPRVD